jgi:hypothetical protein
MFERSENIIIDILEYVLEASYVSKDRKVLLLEKASVKLKHLSFLRLDERK